MLSVESVGKRKGDGYILRNISFSQSPFQHVAIAGETGSGKSTLMKIIAGLVQPDEGAAYLNGERIKGPDDQLVPGHKGVGYLSQHFELRNNYWVHEILEYANKLSKEEAGEIFSICQIDHLLNRRTTELSGGEKQRIATARLLVNDPVLLILDEPYSNLDMIHKQVMKQVISDISAKLKISTILVSHEPDDMLPWADHLLLMRDGIIVQQGRPETLYHQPKDLYCAGLLGKYLVLPGELVMAMSGANIEGNAIVRPEKIKTDGRGLEARIVARQFMGSHIEYIAQAGDTQLGLLQLQDRYSSGDVVRLSIDPSDLIIF